MGRDEPYRLEQSVGYLVNRVAKEMKDELERRMASAGVTAHQWAVVIRLHSGQAETAHDLAGLLGIDAAAVTRLLDRLAAKGLVVRKRHPGDRRAWRVELTPAARRLAPRLPPIARGVLDKFLAGLSPGEVRQLVALLQRVLENAGAREEGRSA